MNYANTKINGLSKTVNRSNNAIQFDFFFVNLNEFYNIFNMQTIVRQPLTSLQLELLKIFERDVPETDLLEIKKFLVQYFAQKAMDLADKVWDRNNWNEQDEDKFLQEHNRTPYKRKKS